MKMCIHRVLHQEYARDRQVSFVEFDLETQIKRDLVSKLVLGEWFTISTDTDYQNIIQNAEKNIERTIIEAEVSESCFAP